jgi:hypothetical protein
MKRVLCGVVILAGAAAALLVAQSGKPYPYPVAYKFGFEYREESVKEDAWQAQFRALHPEADGVPQEGAARSVKLARFWPRYADSEAGALESWQQRQKVAPLPYLDPRTLAARQPTQTELKIEKKGWIAGYMASVRKHPAGK